MKHRPPDSPELGHFHFTLNEDILEALIIILPPMRWEGELSSHSLFLSRNTKAPAVDDDKHLGRGCKGPEASGDGRIELTLQGRDCREQTHSFSDSIHSFSEPPIRYPWTETSHQLAVGVGPKPARPIPILVSSRTDRQDRFPTPTTRWGAWVLVEEAQGKLETSKGYRLQQSGKASWKNED